MPQCGPAVFGVVAFAHFPCLPFFCLPPATARADQTISTDVTGRHITAFFNAGGIDASNAALLNDATAITSATNTGALVGDIGISNSWGTLMTLTNHGSITGGVAGVFVTGYGTIPTLTNAGGGVGEVIVLVCLQTGSVRLSSGARTAATTRLPGEGRTLPEGIVRRCDGRRACR